MCSVWENDKDVQPFENTESSKFDAGPEFQTVLRDVSQRLGFLYNISTGEYVIRL